jgi:hypothetical protein
MTLIPNRFSHNDGHGSSFILMNAWIAFGPLFLSLLFALMAPIYEHFPVPFFLFQTLLLVGGLYLFLKSKLSVIKRHSLFTFGPAGMSPPEKKNYARGYQLVFLATVGYLVIYALP